MWTIFKVFVEFVTILFLFYGLVFWPWSIWALSIPSRDWTHTPCVGRQSLNHCTAREVPPFGINSTSQMALLVKNLPANAGDITDTGSIPGSARSSGGGCGDPLRYSWWEDPPDRGAGWVIQSMGSQRVGCDWNSWALAHAQKPPRKGCVCIGARCSERLGREEQRAYLRRPRLSPLRVRS